MSIIDAIFLDYSWILYCWHQNTIHHRRQENSCHSTIKNGTEFKLSTSTLYFFFFFLVPSANQNNIKMVKVEVVKLSATAALALKLCP